MSGLRSVRVLCLPLIASVLALAQAGSAASRALQQGKVDDAASLLRAHLASVPDDAPAHQLLCRVDYALEMPEPAVNECRKAAELAPKDGEDQLWLGRALGMQAAHANKFAAFGLARQVRTAFERAAQLNPGNVHALTDLGQFYIAAPGIVGGGTEKARKLSAEMVGRFAWQSHWLLGLAAAKEGDLPGAEQELKTSLAIGNNAETQINLALFYQQHGRNDESASSVQHALAMDRSHGPVLVDAASILTDARRLPELAERALREYLANDAKTDAAPAFKVHVQLGRLLARKGDSEGARREFAQSLALASSYAPASKALEQLRP